MGLSWPSASCAVRYRLREGRASGIFGNRTPRFCEVPLHPSRLCHLRHPHPGVDLNGASVASLSPETGFPGEGPGRVPSILRLV